MTIVQGVLSGVNPGSGTVGPPSSALEWLAHPDLNAIPVPSSLYTCQEASGDLIDQIGGIDLSATGTPDYRRTTSSKRYSIYCNGSEYFSPADNAVWDVSTGDISMMGLVYHGATSATERSIWGKKAGITAASAGYALTYRVAFGSHRLRSADGTTQVTSDEGTDQELTWSTPAMVIDQSTANNQIIWNEDGSDTDSVSAIGSMTNTETFALAGSSGLVANQLELGWFAVWDGVVLTADQIAEISAALLTGV